MTSRNGADVAIDTSGATEAHDLCLKALRRKGRFSLVQGFGASPVGLGHFVWSGHSLFGAWHYNLGDYPQIMEVIRRSPLLDLLHSHTFAMSDVQKAFELQATGQCAKVMLRPWE
jgi:threonine dehydrogenase-like Zn-dependent dehydrogenase